MGVRSASARTSSPSRAEVQGSLPGCRYLCREPRGLPCGQSLRPRRHSRCARSRPRDDADGRRGRRRADCRGAPEEAGDPRRAGPREEGRGQGERSRRQEARRDSSNAGQARSEDEPAAKAAPKAKASASSGVATNGLPMQIMVALRSHNVVVVSLWGTGGKIDAMSRDEAAAGASAVGAGFVPLNVLEQGRVAEALTLKLGVVLRAPTVLLFTSGGKLVNTLDGFRDRETVGQAALDALRG